MFLTQPKIRDVLYELPLDYLNNSYHFRFRCQFNEGDQKMYIVFYQRVGWIDISKLLAKVPIIGNSIYVKILVLPSDRENKLFSKDKLKAIGLLEPLGNNIQTTSTSTSNSKPAASPISQKTSGKKQDFLNLSPTQSPTKKEQPKKEAPSKKPYIPGSETPEQRLQEFQRLSRLQDQRKNLEKQAIKIHQDKLNAWGYSGLNTINNLGTLLATLHTVWPSWKPISLTDLLRPEDVKKHLRKALILLHPDKNTQADYETQYLAKRLFELINEAKIAADKMGKDSK